MEQHFGSDSGSTVQSGASSDDAFDSARHSRSLPPSIMPYDLLIHSSDTSDSSPEHGHLITSAPQASSPFLSQQPSLQLSQNQQQLPRSSVPFGGPSLLSSQHNPGTLFQQDRLRVNISRQPLGSFDAMASYTGPFSRSLPESPSSPAGSYSPPMSSGQSHSVFPPPQFPPWSWIMQQQQQLQQQPPAPAVSPQDQHSLSSSSPQARTLQLSPPSRSSSLPHLIVNPPAKPSSSLHPHSPTVARPEPLNLHSPGGVFFKGQSVDEAPMPYAPPMLNSSIGSESTGAIPQNSLNLDLFRDSSLVGSLPASDVMVGPPSPHDPYRRISHYRMPSAPDQSLLSNGSLKPPQPLQQPQPQQQQQQQQQHSTLLHLKTPLSPGSMSNGSMRHHHAHSTSTSTTSSPTIFSVDSPEFSPTSPALQAAVAAATHRNTQKAEQHQRQVISSLLTKLYPNEQNPLKSHAFDGPEWQEYYQARARCQATVETSVRS